MTGDISGDSPAVTVRPFGVLPDGSQVDLYSLTAGGIVLEAMTYGDIICSLKVRDRLGKNADVVLGHAHLDAYHDGSHHLHGGYKGFDQQRWDASPLTSHDSVGVSFSRTSPAGEEHYPGTLACSVTDLLTASETVEVSYGAVTECIQPLRGTRPRNTALSRLAPFVEFGID